jgi:leucyl aminopeptidase (aminopeptidase T)
VAAAGVDPWVGAQRLVDEYAGVKDRDHVIVAYTPDCREVAGRVIVTLRARGSVAVGALAMGALTDDGFAERLSPLMPDPAQLAGTFVFMLLERSTISHTDVVPLVMNRYPACRSRQVRVINAVPELLTHTLNVGPAELSALNSAVLHRLIGKHALHITSDGGTDLRAELDSSTSLWISNRGLAADGHTVLVPSGEVATHPLRLDGVLVADGAYSANVAIDSDTRLRDAPAVIRIQDNEVTDFSCADANRMSILEQLFAVPYARSVGEIGFGTNIGTPDFVPLNSFINERFPGVHIGFGQHNQGGLRPKRDTELHMDFMSPFARVRIDNSDDVLDFRRLAPTEQPHPSGPRVMDEDAETDCCGLRIVERAHDFSGAAGP